MKNLSFGELIAFLLPGFICLWGLSFCFDKISYFSNSNSPQTVAGFLHITLLSLAIGLILSAVRWFFFEYFNLIFVKKKTLRMSQVKNPDILSAFEKAIHNYFNFYMYYSNTFFAIAISYVAYMFTKGWPSWKFSFGIVLILIILYLNSRNSISTFYTTAQEILTNEKREID